MTKNSRNKYFDTFALVIVSVQYFRFVSSSFFIPWRFNILTFCIYYERECLRNIFFQNFSGEFSSVYFFSLNFHFREWSEYFCWREKFLFLFIRWKNIVTKIGSRLKANLSNGSQRIVDEIFQTKCLSLFSFLHWLSAYDSVCYLIENW